MAIAGGDDGKCEAASVKVLEVEAARYPLSPAFVAVIWQEPMAKAVTVVPLTEQFALPE